MSTQPFLRNSQTADAASAAKRRELINSYFITGGLNDPKTIGYVMKMLRELKPLTEWEWQTWYLSNVRDELFLEDLAGDLFHVIPKQEGIKYRECLAYIRDVMFRRSFLSFNRGDHVALKLLNEKISDQIQEAPPSWLDDYAVNFYAKSESGRYLGIQLQPSSYFSTDNIKAEHAEEKLEAFRAMFSSEAFIFPYHRIPDGSVILEGTDMVEKFLQAVKDGVGVAERSEKTEDHASAAPEILTVDFDMLQQYIAQRRPMGMDASYPFIVQHKTGIKDIVWFYFSIKAPDEDIILVSIGEAYVLAPDGRLNRLAVNTNVSAGRKDQEKEDPQGFMADLKSLYRKFSVNRMNSVLWHKADKTLFNAYQQVRKSVLENSNSK